MKKVFVLLAIINNLLFGFDVSSQNSTVYQECKKITDTPKIIGNFGQKSMGGSTGTYVSLIILSLQDVNLENKKIPYKDTSIYQICKKFLLKAKSRKKYDYILVLNDVIKEENNKGKLITFTTLEEMSN